MFEFVADMDSKSAFNWDMLHFVLTRDGQQLPLQAARPHTSTNNQIRRLLSLRWCCLKWLRRIGL